MQLFIGETPIRELINNLTFGLSEGEATEMLAFHAKLLSQQGSGSNTGFVYQIGHMLETCEFDDYTRYFLSALGILSGHRAEKDED